MEIYVVERGEWISGAYPPYATLTSDRWNDYGYVTMFQLAVIDTADRVHEIGNVKIAKVGQSLDDNVTRDFLGHRFSQLSEEFVSLGQEYSYYEAISILPIEIYADVLGALQDAVWLPFKAGQFDNQHVWHTSLLRFGSAAVALKDARNLLLANVSRENSGLRQVIFRTSAGGNEFDLRCNFGHDQYLTSRINAIIGYNGSGKTGILSRLAVTARSDKRHRDSLGFVGENGVFVGKDPQFSSTIMVSYSAFDTFTLPEDLGEQERTLAERQGMVFGYSYCGLRMPTRGSGAEHQEERHKNSRELRTDFVVGLARIKSLRRTELLAMCLEPLAVEPSFSRITDVNSLSELDADELETFFDGLSTGHKITLSIVVHLVLRLQPRSLVLIDEPEAHLHPSLLAAMLKSLSALLEAFDSYCVVATHSPVVLQEIPAYCVSVLQRAGNKTTVRHPMIETFGENVGVITSSVFHLDGSATDFHAKLDELSAIRSESEVEAMFPAGMSPGAKSYYLSRRGGDSALPRF
ncbi:AAA family ATPase [Lentzea sp. NPDC102401]|uniref:AAA family ATPase n=1 Tax=Lentzea sp. NPDC102401 TaxID=3364128 RepID=UPI0037F92DB4